MTQHFRSRSWLRVSGLVAYVLSLFGCGTDERPPAPGATDRPTPNQPAAPLVASFAALRAKTDDGNEVRWDVALVLAEISTIAYDTKEEQIRRIQKLGADVVEPLEKGSSQGLVASDAHSVVIAFRGTELTDPFDIITDIKVFGHRTPEGRTHTGFFKSINALYAKAIAEAIRQGAREKIVWITGHSLGAAMAMVFGHRSTVAKDVRPDGIVTFGQPLAVDSKICQYMLDEFQKDYVRFVNQRDPVTRLLPNYRHAGARVHLNGDNYSMREPKISFSARAGSQAPPVEFEEDNPELRPMTEDEFQELERRLQEQSPEATGQFGTATGFRIPILSNHSMDDYVERLREIGTRKFKRPTGAAP
jgi:hypothetical protein